LHPVVAAVVHAFLHARRQARDELKLWRRNGEYRGVQNAICG
jgi:hypothetical protein